MCTISAGTSSVYVLKDFQLNAEKFNKGVGNSKTI